MSKRYHFGQLNPATMPQNGKYVDKTRPGYFDSLKTIVANDKKPNFLKKIYGPLKGVVLRVENPESSNFNTILNWLDLTDQTKNSFQKLRVRIPELHAHLPDPDIYGDGDEKSNEIIDLYPVFVAQSTNIPAAMPYDIVWVDFIDRENLDEPIYLGKLDSIAASPSTFSAVGNKISKAFDAVANIFSSVDPNSLDQETCGMSRDVTRLPPKCDDTGTSEGDYPVYNAQLVEIAKIKVVKWLNNNKTSKLVRKDVEKSLVLMQQAFIKENGLNSSDITQFINDGFRTYQRQACYYEKYQKCLKEWEQSGANPSTKPFPVARPGFGKHSSGNAVDFNRVQIGNRGTMLWNWLQNNSQRFGWVWRADLRPQEPWHFEFNEELARKNGMIS